MSSLSLRVLELFNENRLSFHETENLLLALSNQTIQKIIPMKTKKRQTKIFIPPHLPTNMSGLTIEHQI